MSFNIYVYKSFFVEQRIPQPEEDKEVAAQQLHELIDEEGEGEVDIAEGDKI